MPLAPFHAKHVSAVLGPRYRFLSPVLGLVSSNSPFYLNNLASFPLANNAPTRALIHELFAKSTSTSTGGAGSKWALTQSKSKAAYYLNSPQRLAHILGLGLTTTATPSSVEGGGKRHKSGRGGGVDSVLLALGIETNKVDGVRTGVSLQKYRDLITFVQGAVTNVDHHGATSSPAIPIYLQSVWQKAGGKQDLWDFYETLREHYIPDLFEGGSGVTEDEFVRDNYSPADFVGDALQHAALDLCAEDETTVKFARSLDLIGANLSTSTWKPVWKLAKHTLPSSTTTGDDQLQQQQEVYDCVEVVVREFIDMLLFDEQLNRFSFDRRRRQQNPVPALVDFYANMAERSERANSEAWFALCQHLPRCDYIKPGSFELFPSLENVFKCTSHLLGLTNNNSNNDGSSPLVIQDAQAFCRAFNRQQQDDDNQHQHQQRLQIEERREMFRPALSDESQRREIALCRLGALCIELTLVRSHRLATAKHSRIGGSEWVVASRAAHLDKMRKSSSSSSVLDSCFWPAFLQDEVLLSMSSEPQRLQDLAAVPWGKDRESNWSLDQSFLGSELTSQEIMAKRLAAQRVLLLGVRAVVRRWSSNEEETEASARVLAWLLARNERGDDWALVAVRLAAELASARPLWTHPAMRDALSNQDEEEEVAGVSVLNVLNVLEGKWDRVSFMDRARFYWMTTKIY